MEIKKSVDLETLTQEEREAFDSGLKTEDDLLAEHEALVAKQEAEREDKFKKAEELANNYKIRSEKAEKALKGDEEKEKKAPKTDSLSQTDLYTLIKADVPQEDINDVTEYAALKKISIADALKSPVVKTILSEKAEERKTADATATNAGRRGNAQVSESTLISKASKGELPESDSEMDRLVEARLDKKQER